ncbi:DUF6207 family protein [Streptomyces sp. NPDC019507]|uniref:DUF6207 family protein n=1 Tax=Streptomyces sp. NPDC019507 TaxID=3154689 RepID=UPI0033C3CC2A
MVDVAAAADATALAFHQLLADRWATASSGAHDPGRARARRSAALLPGPAPAPFPRPPRPGTDASRWPET